MLNNFLTNPHFTIFGLDIYYYAVIIVTGMVLGTVFSGILFKHRNIKWDLILDFFIAVIPMALIGARIFYCIMDGMPIVEWINVRQGGLSILGGVIGGAGGIAIICAIKKVNFFRAADCIVPNLCLGQAIGRWGNYFNQEVYGQLITDPAWQFFPAGVFVEGEWHVALFFIESVLNLIGFAVLFTMAWKHKTKPNGMLVGAYLIFYGTVRSIMEPLRDSAYILGGDAMLSRVLSVLFVFAGITIIITKAILNKKKEGLYFGSLNGEKDGTQPPIES